MYHSNKIQEWLKKLTGFIKSKRELITFKDINSSVIQTLQNSFSYSIENEEVQNSDLNKLFEVESVLDYLQDELNTGHWSEVSIHVRHCFTSASFIKCLILLKYAESFDVELLRNCLKCLDMGLLLGAPLKENSELLTVAAKYLSEEIIEVSAHECKKTQNFESSKRKFNDDHSTYFEKLNAVEIDTLECPSLEYFNKKYFSTQAPVKLKGL